ncbi:xylulokinase [Mycetocola sp. BIGb0189]|uniref:xylulokinase n=1 Tax=Mycetocola sp. BIGb0189 TaxID=2940604 RepID=UPI00216A3786|nr:xylulokinase [Mycetocola sp. BIGb0189]MCS4274970.1 xylulokinase [Mycetocola sp. BIGb0189]
MIISHDLGTTGNKATLVANDGRLIAAVTVHYDTDFGLGGKAEQDPLAWWDALAQATRELLASAGARPEDIDVVSFSGQMMGVVAIDDAGDPVFPSIIWADTRATAQTDRLLDRVGMERGYQITGHRLNPTYSLAKTMWLRDTSPDAFARVRRILLAKDFIAFKLTGVQVTDRSDASSTNAYDQRAGTWSEELIAASGLSREIFPEIVDSTTVIGTITADAARATGLLAGTPVVIGGGDGPMAALGAGIIDASSGAYACMGSSSWVSVAADAPLYDPQMRSMTFNHVIPGRFVPTATMQAGGASLQWIVDTLSPATAADYAELLDAAQNRQASGEGLYFLPHLLGERSPYWNPHARAAFVGLLRHHDRGHMTRAVLEGVAFNLLTGLRAFADCGTDVDRIDVIGGAANASALLQIFADMWGMPVARRDLVDEAGAIGAAVVAGVGVGIFENFEVAATLSKRSTGYEPNPEATARYAREYPVFLDAYARLEPWFDALAAGGSDA